MAADESQLKLALKEALNGKEFKDYGEGLQARVYLDKNKQIYYLLSKGDVAGSWSLQFWVDSYATDRFRLQERLIAIVSVHPREYDLLSYYNARGCRRGTRIVSVEDLKDDLTHLRELLSCFEDGGAVRDSQNTDDNPSENGVGIASTSIAELLKNSLRIPAFQRGYCWRAKNVLGLFNDISSWLANRSEEKDVYHIGTVVLKKREEWYDIIDGQQRLTTLCMYAALKKSQMGSFDLGQNNRKASALIRLTNAAKEIKGWSNTGSIDLERVTVSAIIIGSKESDDLAFGFFNHLNSSGKPLTDYDLLKSHHLRYVEWESLSAFFARKWNRVDHDLLHQMLFRIRHWLRGELFSWKADEGPERKLFNEFKMNWVPLDGICTTRKTPDVDSLILDGPPFFEYVEQYTRVYDVFKKLEVVSKLEEFLLWHSYGTLCHGIKALAFMFFCKFGDTYLKEAVYAIAYCVSRIRNETSVRRDYISKRPEFSEIARIIHHSTNEGEVLGYLLDANRMYSIENRGNTANAYWGQLKELGEFTATEILKNKDVIKRLVEQL